MAVALFGVTLVITRGKPGTLLHGDGRAGDLLVLVGVASLVAYTLGARRFPDFSPLRYTALSATGGTLTILAVDRDRSRSPAPSRSRAPATGRRRAADAYIIFAGAVDRRAGLERGRAPDRRRQRRAVHEPGARS